MSDYRYVRLLKNRLYPTYQLYAQMASKKIVPVDGLRLAALTCLEWLCRRLGDEVPEELKEIPGPAEYKSSRDLPLPSLHIHSGFVVDVVSLPENGIWSMQITEPDLGSDPGNTDQRRAAVPGRMIETNIAFKIVGPQLECGFQTVISDPDCNEEPAEVYRLAVVRELIRNPDFGLRQITTLSPSLTRLSTITQIQDLLGVLKSGVNMLPCVVFTQVRTAEKTLELPKLPALSARSSLVVPLPADLPRATAKPAEDPPYDMAGFAKYSMAFCRTYLIEDGLLERFNQQTGQKLSPGDIALFEPQRFGGAVRVFPFKPNKSRQDEAMAALRQAVFDYPRGKDMSFGRIVFLSAARESLLHSTSAAIQQAEQTADTWAQRLTLLKISYETELRKKDEELAALAGQLDRQRAYQAALKEEKDKLREEYAQEAAERDRADREKDEYIAYLKRKIDQPAQHGQIKDWVERHFSGRLYLHPKAIELLEDKRSNNVSVGLICDALDYLATDYWAQRYERIGEDVMLARCSRKYGRPFEIKPTGETTISFTPEQYNIPYFPDERGRVVDSPLDYHLRVGNAPENLLRIYFLHDDAKKLIVIGSLPRHLRAISIK